MSLETTMEDLERSHNVLPVLGAIEEREERRNLSALLPPDFEEAQFYHDVEKGFVSVDRVLSYISERLGELWQWKGYVRQEFTGAAALGMASKLQIVAQQRLDWMEERYGAEAQGLNEEQKTEYVAMRIIEDAHAEYARLKEGVSTDQIKKEKLERLRAEKYEQVSAGEANMEDVSKQIQREKNHLEMLDIYLRETPEEDRLEDVKTRVDACSWYAERSVEDIAEAYERHEDPYHRLHEKAIGKISDTHQRLNKVMDATLTAMGCAQHRFSGKGNVDYEKLRSFAAEVNEKEEPLSTREVQDLCLSGWGLLASYKPKVFETPVGLPASAYSK